MSMISQPDWGNIPTVSIQLFKFKLFEKEVFTILEKETQFEPFSKFVQRLNNLENFETCKVELLTEILKNKFGGSNPPQHIIQNERMLKNFIGDQFFDMFQKIEEEYQVQLREYKINQINND